MLQPGKHSVVVRWADRVRQEAHQALKRLTCCPYHSQVVPKKVTMAIHGLMGKHWVVQQRQEGPSVVVARNDVWAAVVETREEACSYSQVFHDPKRTHSGALSGSTQTSEVHPAHSFSADYSMEDLMAFDGAQHTQEQRRTDATRTGTVPDSRWSGRRCVRKEMWCSARKRDAAAVLDP